MTTIPDFLNILNIYGSDVVYSRSGSMIVCPCVTPEGFRDPEWHAANPDQPVCNEEGLLPDPANDVTLTVKAFVQPAAFGRTSTARGTPQDILETFGQLETDDHIGIFPCVWNNTTLDFSDWPDSGADYIGYNGLRFVVIAANQLPDPSDGNPQHHWETALRLIDNG